MKDHLYLFLFIIHFSTGCILSDKKQTTVITGYRGGSVVLPCSCADPQSTAKTFTWQFQRSERWTEVFEDEKYRGRLVLFNESSPKNLSLLISDLRTEDSGNYMCMTERHSIAIITELTVKGCILTDKKQTTVITGYRGGSVVLPCSCADPQSTAKTFTWQFERSGRWTEVFKDEKYRGRLVLFNESSPKNLSLLISDLRTEDSGNYMCMTERQSITITIELTVKDCILVQNTQPNKANEVTGYAGESVVLPCSCTELLAKPGQIQWMYSVKNIYLEIYPNEQIESHKNRVKLLNQTTPGNLSLHISALTAEDTGDYYCSVWSQKVFNRLHVKEKPHIYTHISLSTQQPSHQTQELAPPQPTHHTPQFFSTNLFILLGVILPVLLLILLAFIYWRCRGGRNVKKVTSNEEELKGEQDNPDDVTYSSVVHVKTASAAHTESYPSEHTEYAPIKIKR